MAQNDRVVRVLLPMELIKRMDEAIVAGKGGYETRQTLIRDAVEAFLLELTHEPAPPEPVAGRPPVTEGTQVPPGTRATGGGKTSFLAGRPSAQWDGTRALTEMTEISAPPRGPAVDDGIVEIVDQPFFGLHNRDYPSIWAASHLAQLVRDGPVALHDFHASVVEAAWRFAAELKPFEKVYEQKFTALFPTNSKKPESAAETFITFAVGICEVIDGSKVRASGPLYAWRVCRVVRRGSKLLIGLTSSGYELLHALAGMTIWTPHPADKAEVFFDHLRRMAPADWWGFAEVLRLVEPGITRAELVAGFQRDRPDWTPTQASTIAGGYIARAREWGLIEPKLQNGRYILTDFGGRTLTNEREGSHAGV